MEIDILIFLPLVLLGVIYSLFFLFSYIPFRICQKCGSRATLTWWEFTGDDESHSREYRHRYKIRKCYRCGQRFEFHYKRCAK